MKIGKRGNHVVEDLYRMPDDGYRYELVRGHLVSEPLPGGLHGVLVTRIAAALHQHVDQGRHGVVATADAGFILSRDPDTLRGPDIAYLTRSRFDALEEPEKAIPGPPDLAVEVLSPSDRLSAVRAKVDNYLESGCEIVWVVEPASEQITVYRQREEARVLTGDDVLGAEPVLPEFAIRVGELFNY